MRWRVLVVVLALAACSTPRDTSGQPEREFCARFDVFVFQPLAANASDKTILTGAQGLLYASVGLQDAKLKTAAYTVIADGNRNDMAALLHDGTALVTECQRFPAH